MRIICFFVNYAHLFERAYFTERTPQPLKTFTGVNPNPLKTFRIIRLSMHTTNKRLNLDALNFAHICMWKRYVHMPMFIQMVNVLDLHFQGQILESNTCASAYVKWTLVRTNYTTIPINKISRGIRLCNVEARNVLVAYVTLNQQSAHVKETCRPNLFYTVPTEFNCVTR